ncbi:MAG: hypothetical protein ACNS61_08540 [Candidatus Wenzhouxiangella sp. M2_3B_020]
MRKTLLLAFCTGLVAGCEFEVPGESRQPRCEPRGSAEPGRLNISSEDEGSALSEPCRARLRFYIAGNTPLRELETEILLLDNDGERVAATSTALRFGDAGAGMFVESVELPPVPAAHCLELRAHVADLSCRDGEGRRIECPAVRLKTSYVLEDVTIETGNLNVCYD